MRTPLDRLRHALLFEIIALMIIAPVGAWVFTLPVHQVGIVGAVSAAIAALWNMVYNHLFDHAMMRRYGTTLKSQRIRALHAVLFEGGLLLVLVPFIKFYLDVSWTEAAAMDVATGIFYVLYAYAFNWGYDRLFPLPEWDQ
ncbi:PACE efflux transporter [Donghicola tyrosinivorans]|uniref:Putative membrane protein n=1 Tax=Donghicola tyrosinivorans TaxID=1652492 RepID=A0A2T0WU53_9RHOB|nr:PACE efflux transporter [Donghicola tyrosinivorans]PRY90209.1 putative membrane protein [Donghicola tyrosinivorans]